MTISERRAADFCRRYESGALGVDLEGALRLLLADVIISERRRAIAIVEAWAQDLPRPRRASGDQEMSELLRGLATRIKSSKEGEAPC